MFEIFGEIYEKTFTTSFSRFTFYLTRCFSRHHRQIGWQGGRCQHKEALPFCNITVVGTSLGTVADLDGNYVILNIPPGDYSVRAQFVGYQPVVTEHVSVSIDLTSNVDFSLNEARLSFKQWLLKGSSTQ